MCSTSLLTCIKTMVFKFTLVFIIAVKMFSLFLTNVAELCIFVLFLLFDNAINVNVLFKVNYLHSVLYQGFTKLFYAIFTSAYIFLIFFTIKSLYRGHWISPANMITYFWCSWFFRVATISIYSFNPRFKIFINNRCSLIRFPVLIKL